MFPTAHRLELNTILSLLINLLLNHLLSKVIQIDITLIWLLCNLILQKHFFKCQI